MTLAATPADAASPTPPGDAAAEPAAKRILVVDERTDTFEGLRSAVAAEGLYWQVEHVADGDDALQFLAHRPADVVIADEQLPGTDGVTLLTRVRDRYPDTIRMIVSGAAKPGLAAIVAHRLLSKPCNVAQLGALIQRSCALHDRSGEIDAYRKNMAATALPSRPGVYMELNQILADPTWQPAQVAAVIEGDVALSAKVLQLANSALFGLTSTVTSVRDAVVYLGVDMVRSLALTAQAFGKLTPRHRNGLSLDDFQTHAMLVARIAASILPAGRTQQEAVTAALLHDIGKLVLASDGSGRWDQLQAEAQARRIPVYQLERETEEVGHADLGAHLLSLWGLPDTIVEAVAHHHDPGSVDGMAFDGVAVVHIANALAHEVVPSAAGPPPSTLDEELVERLGMGARVELWRHQARQLTLQS